jgi:hypothetical protein
MINFKYEKISILIMANKILITVFLILSLSLCVACQTQQEYILCPDNTTKVFNLSSCPIEKPKCPVCESNITCQIAKCGQDTNYTCKYETIKPCVGKIIRRRGQSSR